VAQKLTEAQPLLGGVFEDATDPTHPESHPVSLSLARQPVWSAAPWNNPRSPSSQLQLAHLPHSSYAPSPHCQPVLLKLGCQDSLSRLPKITCPSWRSADFACLGSWVHLPASHQHSGVLGCDVQADPFNNNICLLQCPCASKRLRDAYDVPDFQFQVGAYCYLVASPALEQPL